MVLPPPYMGAVNNATGAQRRWKVGADTRHGRRAAKAVRTAALRNHLLAADFSIR
jgi:hypothetical protein